MDHHNYITDNENTKSLFPTAQSSKRRLTQSQFLYNLKPNPCTKKIILLKIVLSNYY